jgi:hypothetical protein
MPHDLVQPEVACDTPRAEDPRWSKAGLRGGAYGAPRVKGRPSRWASSRTHYAEAPAHLGNAENSGAVGHAVGHDARPAECHSACPSASDPCGLASEGWPPPTPEPLAAECHLLSRSGQTRRRRNGLHGKGAVTAALLLCHRCKSEKGGDRAASRRLVLVHGGASSTPAQTLFARSDGDRRATGVLSVAEVHQRLELTDPIRVAPEHEAGLEALLRHGQPQLVEPGRSSPERTAHMRTRPEALPAARQARRGAPLPLGPTTRSGTTPIPDRSRLRALTDGGCARAP